MTIDSVVSQHDDSTYQIRWTPYVATDEKNARAVQAWWVEHDYGSSLHVNGSPSSHNRVWEVQWDNSMEQVGLLEGQPAFARKLHDFRTAPAPPHMTEPQAPPGTTDPLPAPTRPAPLARTMAGHLQVSWTSAPPTWT